MMNYELITLNSKKFRGKRTNAPSSVSSRSSSTSAQSDVSFDTFVNCHMRHPWGVVDYHLYLGHIEGGRDPETRLGQCYLYEKDGFKNIVMTNDINIDNVPDKEHPIIIFLAMPIVNIIPFYNSMLVLAFDLGTHKLQGYHFNTDEPLESYDELWQAWRNGEGELTVEANVVTFLDAVKSVVLYELQIMDNGILFHNGFSARRFTSGSEVALKDYEPCERELREIMMNGSREAWFAARRHLTLLEFRQMLLRQSVAMNFFWTQEARDMDPEEEMDQPFLDPHPLDPVKVVEVPTPTTSGARSWLNASWVPNTIQMLIAFLLAICFLTAFDYFVKSFSAPARNTSQMSLFGWWPFGGEAQQQPEIFGLWSLKQVFKHMGTLLQWPLYQILQRVGLFKFLPFGPETQEMRQGKWWSLKQNNHPIFGRLPWSRGMQNSTVHEWWPFKQETRNITKGLFNWLPSKPHARRSGIAGGWPAASRTQSVPTGPFGVAFKPRNSFKYRFFMG
ncbi:unnamed protein product [Penicillium bialowiezense]